MKNENTCIVVVEDNQDILCMVCDMLVMAGFEPHGYAGPFDIASLEFEPDLFLFDMMLPICTGVDLARKIRGRENGSTPIVAMSASRGMIEVAKESGCFQGFIYKPFDLDDFISTIEDSLAA